MSWRRFAANSGIWTHCSAAYHNDSARHVNMVYGDYFFVEAVRKLCGDGSEEVFSLEKTAVPQRFAIAERTATGLTLGRLIKADDNSPFPALPGAQRYLFLISCAQQISCVLHLIPKVKEVCHMGNAMYSKAAFTPYLPELERLSVLRLSVTLATAALQNGVDVKTVSSMPGRYDAGFTLRTYTCANASPDTPPASPRYSA